MMKQLILKSKYREKVNCILLMLNKVGIKNIEGLENAPRTLGHFCGIDIYQFVAEMNKIHNEVDLTVLVAVDKILLQQKVVKEEE